MAVPSAVPIIKNKLFFFGDYQGTKETTGVTNTLTVPTAQRFQHLYRYDRQSAT